MVPIMGKDKEEKREPAVTTSNVSDNVSRNIDNDDDDKDDNFRNDVKDVTIGEFGKFVRLQETLENQIERRNLKHQPMASFGEKLGMKIEERMSDTMIDRMLGGMFNVGGATTPKPTGWLEITKVILDSGFAQQAGAKLPETIVALKSTIGEERTNALADAAINAIGPKKEKGIGPSPEEEQKKMEKFVLGLNPVNILDVKKFMDLVNANPANNKVTDTTQARNILIEEQNRIRRENPILANEIALNNQDRDMGMGQISPYGQQGQQQIGGGNGGIGSGGQFGNSIDRLPGDMMGNMMPTNVSSSGTNQMSTEQILALDPDNDMSVNAFAWSNGYGNMLSEPNGLGKVKNILRRHQDELTKQLQGLGGSVETEIGTGTKIGIEQEQEITEQEFGQQGDMKWGEEDIGKKGVGKGKRYGNEDIIVPPGVANTAKADSAIDNEPKEYQQSVEQLTAQNNILELLQKMAQNFDSGINEINQKLQAVENRVAKVESVSSKTVEKVEVKEETAIPTSDITINETNVRTAIDMELAEKESQENDDIENEDIENDISEEVIQKEETVQKAETISETKEETKEIKTVINLVSEEDTKNSNSVHKKAPNSVIDYIAKEEIPTETKPWIPPTEEEKRLAKQHAIERDSKLLKEETKEEISTVKSQFPKGTQGWLKEQKEKNKKK
jgi:hypothetical protein